MLKVATAFSGGFGSVEFALKYLDIPHEVVFACEWMKPQRESYILNHGEPISNFYEDIRTLDGIKYKGEIYYYHLSPPCQSYSIAGSRGGAADDRGGLMFEAIKSIDEVQPKMFSVENVKGLLSSNGGEDWKNIIRDFKSLKGYTISWGVMNAKEQGTPQNRERVFIVGFRGQSPQFSFPPRKELDVFLYHLLEDYVDEKYFLKPKTVEKFIFCENEKGNQVGMIGNEKSKKHNSITNRILGVDSICSTITTFSTGGNQQPKVLVKIKSNTKNGYEIAKQNDGISLSRPNSTTRRGRVGKQVSQTLDTSCSIGILLLNNEKFGIKKLSPRECARVQGDLKDMFKFCKASDTKLYEFIGNAMDINTTKNLILRMLDHLKNNVKLNPPINPTFKRKKTVATNLFDIEVA